MVRKFKLFRGLKTGIHGARRRVTRRGLKGRRTHKQKWSNIAFFELLVAVLMFVTWTALDGTLWLIGSLAMSAASAIGFVSSRSTPPAARHVVQNPQRDKLKPSRRASSDDARVTHGSFRVTPVDRVMVWWRGGMGGDRPRHLLGRRPCGAACQYSYAPVEQCECSCGGDKHGTKAPVIMRKNLKKRRTPAPGKTRPRKPRAKTTSTRKPATRKPRP